MFVAAGLFLLAIVCAISRVLLIPPAPALSGKIAFAVLGDSDSHAYHDTILIPLESGKRGGKYRATTFQWTEILQKLRPDDLDQGSWGEWGTRIKIAEVLDWSGIGGRAPRKRDFRYNFAVSSAECSELMTGYHRQVPRLLTDMNRASEIWKDGIVFIQIGVNSLGQNHSLDQYAKDGLTPILLAGIHACVEHQRQTVELISTAHPGTRFVLAGLFDNSNMPENKVRWTAAELKRISAAIDEFDRGLREISHTHRNVAFIDQRAWFHRYWGGRDVEGNPAYKGVNLGGKNWVTLSSGDEPFNAVLADNHGGVVYNALWARECVDTLNTAFGLGIRPLTTAEIAQIADPDGTWGLRKI